MDWRGVILRPDASPWRNPEGINRGQSVADRQCNTTQLNANEATELRWCRSLKASCESSIQTDSTLAWSSQHRCINEGVRRGYRNSRLFKLFRYCVDIALCSGNNKRGMTPPPILLLFSSIQIDSCVGWIEHFQSHAQKHLSKRGFVLETELAYCVSSDGRPSS